MRVLLIFLCLLFAGNIDAQVTFRTYFQGSGNNLPRNGCYVPGGGYIICSSGNSFIRLDSIGNVIWAITIQSPVYIESVAVTSDTAFVFSGYTNTFGPAIMNEIAAGKLDANGNVLWMSVIDSTNKMIKTIPVPTDDGGVIVCTTEPPTLFAGTFFTGIARFSASGQLLWHKTVNADPSVNYLFDAESCAGNFVVSARSDTTAWMFSFDSLGTVMWSRKNNSLPSFVYSPVDIVRMNNGYVTTIRLNNLFYFDTSGVAVTERKYSSPTGTLTLESLLATSDHGLLVGGRVITPGGDSLMLLMKTDSTGVVSWATTYDTTVRSIRNMTETPDGFLITREMSNVTILMLLKTELQGNANCGERVEVAAAQNVPGLVSNVQGQVTTNSWAQSIYHPAFVVVPKVYTQWSCDGVGIPENESVNEVLVYPNPSSGIFYLDESVRSDASIELYNVSGQLIWRRMSDENFIDLSDRADGIYLLKISSGETSTFQKLILTH